MENPVPDTASRQRKRRAKKPAKADALQTDSDQPSSSTSPQHQPSIRNDVQLELETVQGFHHKVHPGQASFDNPSMHDTGGVSVQPQFSASARPEDVDLSKSDVKQEAITLAMTMNGAEVKRGKKRQRVASGSENSSPEPVQVAEQAKKPLQRGLGLSKKHSESRKETSIVKSEKLTRSDSVVKASKSSNLPSSKTLDTPKGLIVDSSLQATNDSAFPTSIGRQLMERAQSMRDKDELDKVKKELIKARQDLEELKRERALHTKEVEFKDEVIIAQDKITEELKQALTCNVCLEVFTDPHTLAPCGHTACAACLRQWFGSVNSLANPLLTAEEPPNIDLKKRSRACFTCRTPVICKPIAAFLMNEMLATLKSRITSGQDDATTTGSPHIAAAVERTAMWDDLFDAGRDLNRRWFDDAADDVRRCGDCGHEINGNQCYNCGLDFSDLSSTSSQRAQEREEMDRYAGGFFQDLQIPQFGLTHLDNQEFYSGEEEEDEYESDFIDDEATEEGLHRFRVGPRWDMTDSEAEVEAPVLRRARRQRELVYSPPIDVDEDSDPDVSVAHPPVNAHRRRVVLSESEDDQNDTSIFLINGHSDDERDLDSVHAHSDAYEYGYEHDSDGRGSERDDEEFYEGYE